MVILFELKTPDIKISVSAYFDKGNLVIDGYDIGKTVSDYWGDSDYEYTTTINSQEVRKLYKLLDVEIDENTLLQVIADRFNTNTCFSDFRNFCEENDVRYEGFSWT